jgi:DNA polymerase V
VLAAFAPRQMIYSIDECFIDLSGCAGLDPTATGQAIRRRVDRWLGLPVAVGIGPTPTLAKLANHLAVRRQHKLPP